MSLDGHFILTTSTKQLVAGWITLQDEEFLPPKPCLFKVLPEENKSEKKKKSFLGFKFSSEVNFASLCKDYSVEKPSSKYAIEEHQYEDEEEEKVEKIESKTQMPQVSEAKNAIAQALQSVNERGDKIKTLDVKIREMSERSQKFAEMAADLAKKEKNKKWWQL